MARTSSAPISRPRSAAPRSIEDEIAHLRDLDLAGLRARWKTETGRVAANHFPKHILFGTLAYRLQAEAWGDLDAATVQLLNRAAHVQSKRDILPLTAKLNQRKHKLTAGTVLMREWNGQHHRVTVLEDSFIYEGKTFSSLSTIASQITGTKWNGPRFFGLRTAIDKEAQR